MRILTSRQMREAERASLDHGQTYLRLMENAGAGAFAILARREESLAGKRCVVLCGEGNNGGDGFVVARRLALAGGDVTAVLAGGDPRSEEAREMLRLLRAQPVSILPLRENRPAMGALILEANILVDALFGTGFRGTLPEDCGFLAEMCALSKAKIYALDIPSGINADTGETQAGGRSFRADCTVAFGCLKPAHINPDAARQLGDVEVCELGIAEEVYAGTGANTYLIDRELAASMFHKRPDDSHKGSFGKLLAVAGSLGMTGAAVLAASAASRSGAGLVYLAAPRSVLFSLSAHLVEQVMLPMPETEEGTLSSDAVPALCAALKGKSACLFGCGVKQGAGIQTALRAVAEQAEGPMILDADGINALCGDINIMEQAKHGMVLTPHYGEFSRLTGYPIEEIAQNRVALAREFAARHRVTLVLKGAYTVVAQPDQSVYLCHAPNSGLAKGGSGDLLAGIVGGLLAQGYCTRDAAVCGVYVHSQAAELTARRLSKTSMQPSDVLCDLHPVFAALETP